MKYYKHQFVSKDRTLELYFAGCSIQCENCHNKFLWDKNVGKEMRPIEIMEELCDYIPIAKVIHILGGEPTEQPHNELIELITLLSNYFNKVPKILFTGTDLIANSNGMLFLTGTPNTNFDWQKIDFSKSGLEYIKVGRYIDKLGQQTDKLINIPLGSTNQYIIDLRKRDGYKATRIR